MQATITNFLPIDRVTNWPDGRQCIYIRLANGWETLEPLCKKVLEYNGKTFTFMAWNSDRNEAWWVESKQYATIK